MSQPSLSMECLEPEGRKEGKKKGRKEGREEGGKERRKEGRWKEGILEMYALHVVCQFAI